jgi:hypothetical protein
VTPAGHGRSAGATISNQISNRLNDWGRRPDADPALGIQASKATEKVRRRVAWQCVYPFVPLLYSRPVVLSYFASKGMTAAFWGAAMSGDNPVPYDESPFPGWAAAVNSWPWNSTETSRGQVVGWWKEGVCVRCHHPIEIEIGLIEPLIAQTSSHVYAECDCKVAHTAGQVGCGVSAEVDGPGRD